MSLDMSKQQEIADFLQRYENDPTSISADEAAGRYQQLIALASPETAAEAHDQAFAQLPAHERQMLAREFQSAHADAGSAFDGYTYGDLDSAAAPRTLGLMAQQASQQDGGLLDRLLGKDSPLNSTLGRMAMAAVAAYLARKVLGGQSQQSDAPAGGAGGLDIGGLLDMLSKMQGGSRGDAPSRGAPAGGAGGLDIGDLLDALGKMQGGGQGGAPSRSVPTGGAGGLDIGDLLDALGKMQGGGQGGAPSRSVPTGGAGGLDIGDLLDALGKMQGGAQSGAASGAAPTGGAGGLDIGGLLDALGKMQGGAQGDVPQQRPTRPTPPSESPTVQKPDLSVLLGEKDDSHGGDRPDLSALLDDDNQPNKKS